jgi:hypothetical protein
MAANASLGKERTGTIPYSFFEAHQVAAVVSAKLGGESGEVYSVWFLCVALCFLDLPYQAGIHIF